MTFLNKEQIAASKEKFKMPLEIPDSFKHLTFELGDGSLPLDLENFHQQLFPGFGEVFIHGSADSMFDRFTDAPPPPMGLTLRSNWDRVYGHTLNTPHKTVYGFSKSIEVVPSLGEAIRENLRTLSALVVANPHSVLDKTAVCSFSKQPLPGATFYRLTIAGGISFFDMDHIPVPSDKTTSTIFLNTCRPLCESKSFRYLYNGENIVVAVNPGEDLGSVIREAAFELFNSSFELYRKKLSEAFFSL